VPGVRWAVDVVGEVDGGVLWERVRASRRKWARSMDLDLAADDQVAARVTTDFLRRPAVASKAMAAIALNATSGRRSRSAAARTAICSSCARPRITSTFACAGTWAITSGRRSRSAATRAATWSSRTSSWIARTFSDAAVHRRPCVRRPHGVYADVLRRREIATQVPLRADSPRLHCDNLWPRGRFQHVKRTRVGWPTVCRSSWPGLLDLPGRPVWKPCPHVHLQSA
jgi:hypothetical protein